MTVENELVNLCVDESPPRNKPLVAMYLRYLYFYLLIFVCLTPTYLAEKTILMSMFLGALLIPCCQNYLHLIYLKLAVT